MKRVFKILGIVLLGLILIVAGSAFYVNSSDLPYYENNAPNLTVEVDSISIARGAKLAALTCMECHSGKNTRVLEGKKLEDLDPAFGEAFAPNITQHPEKGIGRYTDGELAFLLRTGIKKNGQYSPPWMPKFPNMSDEDLHDIIAFFRSDDPSLQPSEVEQPMCKPSFLAKVLTRIAFKPFAYPQEEITAPKISDKVAHGRYLANSVYHCYGCHSADFKTNDDLNPENSAGLFGGGNKLIDLDGNTVLSTNITLSKTSGIGHWSEADFINAVKWGKRPDGSLILYPMGKFTLLEDEEVGAIYAYLETVPVID